MKAIVGNINYSTIDHRIPLADRISKGREKED